MKITKICILAVSLVLSSLSAEAKPKYGPAGKPKATPIGSLHSFFQSPAHPAPDFWALVGYYVPQMNGRSCSSASVAAVLNAARLKLPKTSDDKVVTETDLLDKVKTEKWKERLSEDGLNGSYGLNLDQLGAVTLDSFKMYGFTRATVQVVHIADVKPATQALVVKNLRLNDASDKDFILANFVQGAYTDDADVGHISPVGAFDAEKKRVLILDVDRDWYEPYWVSLEDFVAGMATKDKGASAFRGYVWIRTGE